MPSSYPLADGSRAIAVVPLSVDGTGQAAPATSGSTSAFLPIAAATVALTVGPTATTAPVALAANTASVYRIRNASTSASPAAWRLQTATPGTAPTVPTAYTTAGTGGTAGDKMIDPGGVEVYSLSAAQQTAIAAGTLYLSAITAAGGSATIYVTPGVSGV